MKEDISQTDNMLSLQSKSLDELEGIRARLLLLESKLDKSSLSKFQSNLEKELEAKETLLSRIQASQNNHLTAKTRLEEAMQKLLKELETVEESLSLAEKDTRTARQEIDRLTTLKIQQQSVLEKIQQNSQRNQEVLARINELIREKTTLESSHEALMRILDEQNSLIQTLNAPSSSTMQEGECFFEEPANETGKVEGVEDALFAVATSLTKMSNSSSSSSATVLFPTESKMPCRSTVTKKRVFSPPPSSALPSKRKLRSACKRETETPRSNSNEQLSRGGGGGSVVLEKDIVHEFLHAKAGMVCEMFMKQHSHQRKGRKILECFRIESGLWRYSDEDAAKYGLKHIIGNNNQKQSFSVVLRSVRISQRILDELINIAAETDKKFQNSIPASFEDPRDASEIAEQLRLMYDVLYK